MTSLSDSAEGAVADDAGAALGGMGCSHSALVALPSTSWLVALPPAGYPSSSSPTPKMQTTQMSTSQRAKQMVKKQPRS